MDLLHAAARLSVDWMAYCLIEGAILALFMWLLLRLLPRQNAGTRFLLWFTALVAILVLPFLRGAWPWRTTAASSRAVSSGHALITLSDSVAFYIFAAWAVFAGLGLMRVALGLWQVRKLRNNSQKIDLENINPAVKQAVDEFSRSLSLRISDNVRVPTAVGFFAPTVIVPNWFLEEMPVEELRHVLLHEAAHLQRRDDWTNLLQKIIKAVLFFHPSAWWIEQQLSLEREIACDDAVLAQVARPQDYAQCLKHVAEKSFLRRKLALAQAIVTRMRQLSLRMARILDADRPGTTRLWKPAVPIVVAVASICGLSAATAPELVSFSSKKPPVRVVASLPATPATEVKTDLSSSVAQPKVILASAAVTKPVTGKHIAPQPRAPLPHHAQNQTLRVSGAPKAVPHVLVSGDYVVQSEQVFVTMTSDRVNRAGQPVWQVYMWQVRVLVPVNQPDKNIPRKNI